MILKTDRLTLRPLVQADWQALAQIGQIPKVARMLPSLAYPWTEPDIKAWIKTYQWTGELGFRLAICLSDGQLIGTVGLYGDPTGLAYFVDPSHWGQGVAVEASKALLADAALRFGLTSVVSGVFHDNFASIRVLEKLGFERVGQGIGTAPARTESVTSYTYFLSL